MTRIATRASVPTLHEGKKQDARARLPKHMRATPLAALRTAARSGAPALRARVQATLRARSAQRRGNARTTSTSCSGDVKKYGGGESKAVSGYDHEYPYLPYLPGIATG